MTYHISTNQTNSNEETEDSTNSFTNLSVATLVDGQLFSIPVYDDFLFISEEEKAYNDSKKKPSRGSKLNAETNKESQ